MSAAEGPATVTGLHPCRSCGVELDADDSRDLCEECEGPATVTLTDDGQANTCAHMSASGVDTAPIGPGKVWACDHCGLEWSDGRGRGGTRADAKLTADERHQYAVFADRYPGDQLVYSLTSVESIVAARVGALTADLTAARAEAEEWQQNYRVAVRSWTEQGNEYRQVIANVRALADEHWDWKAGQVLAQRLRALLPAAPTGEGS